MEAIRFVFSSVGGLRLGQKTFGPQPFTKCRVLLRQEPPPTRLRRVTFANAAKRQYPKGAPQWGDIVPEAQLSGGPGGGQSPGCSRLMGWQLVVMKSTLFR